MTLSEVIRAYATSPVGYAFAGLLGALFGSFANVCIYRLPPTDEHPKGQSIVSPGSHCGACGAAVRWYDNIPILSYFLLRGHCRACGAEFSARYLFVEAATAMLFVAVWHLVFAVGYVHEAPSTQMIRAGTLSALMFVLVVITFIDIDHQLILDKITYPSIPLFYGLSLLLPGHGWKAGLIGIAVGYGGVRLIADGYFYLTGREGMGYGDGKLLALIGALYGWQGVLVSLFVGSLVGSVIGIGALLVARRHAPPASEEIQGDEAEEEEVALRHVPLPFGPFLAAGAIVYAFSQPWLHVSFRLLQ